MKKILSLILLVIGLTVNAQGKKPRIIIVPSEIWCTENGYSSDGVIDYKKALTDNSTLLSIITEGNQFFSNNGFELTNLNDVLNQLAKDEAVNMTLENKNSFGVSESFFDQIMRTAQADVWIQIYFDIREENFGKRYCQFNVQVIDSYSKKQLAGNSNRTQSSSADSEILAKTAVIDQFGQMISTLIISFEDKLATGRDGRLVLKIWESSNIDFETIYNSEEYQMEDELRYIIEEWVYANSVGGNFNTGQSSATSLEFYDVKIPLVNDRGRKIDTQYFLRGLQRTLRSEPFSLETKLVQIGLGEAWLIIE